MLLAGFDGIISDCFTARLRSYSQCKHNAEPHDSASDLHLGYAKVGMADTIGNWQLENKDSQSEQGFVKRGGHLC